MGATTDDDPDTVPEAEFLTMPEEATPASGLTPEEKQQRHSGYEQEFQDQLEARAWRAPSDFESAGSMDDLGDEYTLSTVPAFTRAATAPDEKRADERDGTETATADMTKAPRPSNQRALKP